MLPMTNASSVSSILSSPRADRSIAVCLFMPHMRSHMLPATMMALFFALSAYASSSDCAKT